MMVNMGMYDNDDTGHAWLRTSRAASIAYPASRFMRYFICMCTTCMSWRRLLPHFYFKQDSRIVGVLV